MSLVERALKKLQQSGSGGDARASRAHFADPIIERTSNPDVPPGAIERPGRILRIDREKLRSLQVLPPAEFERRIASQYQQIKRQLIAIARGQSEPSVKDGNLIMVASALPGEGKTFTSINLALSMAREKDVDVILVNADVAKPRLDSLFGVAGERGLLDLLLNDDLHPDAVILDTDVPTLRFLPAGRYVDTATELLASARMHELMQQLISRPSKPIVLFDSPPLLLSTESRAMVASVGQVLLVVRANVTPRRAVEEAIAAAASARSISLVLNQCTEWPSDTYYYYGYGPYGEANGNASAVARE
jgi:exopolysaccharide/PEP-CTERM locus tyrosine autokinase